MNELKRIRAEKAAGDNGWAVPGQPVADSTLLFVNPAHRTELVVEDREGAQYSARLTSPQVAETLGREFLLQDAGFLITDIDTFFRRANQVALSLTAKSYGPHATRGNPVVPTAEPGASPEDVVAALPPDLQRLAGQNPTVRDALVKQRVGQDKFRAGLERVWNNRCPVTGIDHPAFLVASHIKPWADCDDRERLDPYNGILFAVHIDRLFDGGWITFDPAGNMVLSHLLQSALASQLLQGARATALKVSPSHEPYLAYHRANVFKGQ